MKVHVLLYGNKAGQGRIEGVYSSRMTAQKAAEHLRQFNDTDIGWTENSPYSWTAGDTRLWIESHAVHKDFS